MQADDGERVAKWFYVDILILWFFGTLLFVNLLIFLGIEEGGFLFTAVLVLLGTMLDSLFLVLISAFKFANATLVLFVVPVIWYLNF